MEKDKLYFFYDGEMPLGAWMGEVCQTCVEQFGYGTDACEKCPFELSRGDCLMCKLNRENNYYLNKIDLWQIKDSVTLSQWQFLKSHCCFKDEYDEYDEEDDEVEEMEPFDAIKGLAAKQEETNPKNNVTGYNWNFGKPKKNGSYIVVTVYSDDHDDKVKSMYLADWCNNQWDGVPYEDIVLCWTPAPEMPVISLSIGDKIFTF